MHKSLLAGCFVLGGISTSASAVILSPLTTFGGGDGWLAPGDRAYLTTDNTQRGMAYNQITNHLVLVNRAGGLSVNVLDATSGADMGTMNVTGVTGGTFALNMVGVGSDGAIYAGNLTTDATVSPYKVYRWASEGAVPTTAFTGAPLAGARFGDTIDVTGLATGTRIAAGISNVPAVPGNNGYGILTTADGLSYTGTAVGFVGTPPNAGDHRLGVTFADSDTIMGTQGGTGNPVRISDFSGSSGTLTNSPVLATINERPMDFAMVFGTPMLATVETTTSILRLYDMSDFNSPVLLASLTTRVGPSVANANGVGAVAWGDIGPETATLYVLNTNNGIQAFHVEIPEPASLGLLGACGIALLARRRR